MKHEVLIKYQDLDDAFLEMLIEILSELGLDEKAEEVSSFMNESETETSWEEDE